jgi:hypothetical protein
LPGAAAAAVRDTNCGTMELKATSDELFNVRARNWRRLTMIGVS